MVVYPPWIVKGNYWGERGYFFYPLYGKWEGVSEQKEIDTRRLHIQLFALFTIAASLLLYFKE